MLEIGKYGFATKSTALWECINARELSGRQSKEQPKKNE